MASTATTSKSQPETVRVAGRTIRVTNPDKVLYPSVGATKRDIVNYYRAVAPTMLPHIVGRPITRKRWPDGVDHEPFFEKNLGAGTPEWVPSRVRHQSRRDIRYPVADSAATVVWLAQRAAIELHVPQWRFDAAAHDGDPAELNPDRLVLDLDPGPGAALSDCVTVAHAIRDALGDSGDTLVPVTSGSKGIHLYLALNGTMTSAEVSEWAHALARQIERDLPKLAVSRMTKSLRSGKVFIDWSQNNAEKTTVAPYSLRGRDAPTVAAPRLWEELDDPGLAQLEFREVLRRLGEMPDPMADLGWPLDDGSDNDSADGGPGRNAGDPRGVEPPPRDRLEVYRSKRSADRTPEPVPEVPSSRRKGPSSAKSRSARRGGTEPTFVIQEHHARRLHYDFRLEHDGVLVSWAVPKGLPTSPRDQRLAVQTEDHPLEYGTFEGTIPRGEYGAGEVTIWDSGHYRLEKWRDDEVIAVLDGTRARGRYALIRTNDKNWLVHRMKDQTGGSGRGSTAMPRDISPMLTTLGTAADVTGDGWQLEGKWDGVRAIAEVADGKVAVHGRSGTSFTRAYPEPTELGDALRGHTAVLDGEIVVLGSDGAPQFGRIQQRIGKSTRRDVTAAMKDHPAFYYVFDVMYLDGVDLMSKSLADRRDILEHLAIDTDHCRVPALLSGTIDEALAEARRRRLEGIIAKKRRSHYLPGRRPGSWVKVKFRDTQDAVVVGWRPGNGRRSGSIGSLLLAVPASNRDGLRYVGRVGTGFDEPALQRLHQALKPLRRKTSPVAGTVPTADARDAVWVRPALVVEVTYAEFTSDGRLRQASWRGLRPEMSPDDVSAPPELADHGD